MNKQKFIEFCFITLGTTLMILGFYFFLEPLKIVIGGFMGIITLVEPFLSISLSTASLIMNTIALILGLILLGKQFFVRTVYSTLLSPLIFFILENTVPSDFIVNQLSEMPLMLGAIFGGVMVGGGIGLVVRYNATTGGMDVIQRIINKYAKIPFVVALYLTDGVLVLIGLFTNIEIGLFGVIAMIISSVVLERVAVMGRVSFTFLIITDHGESIKNDIFAVIDRGVTRVKVIGGFSNQEKEMLLCTLYRQELYALKNLVLKHDPKAFTLVLNTKEVVGNGFFGDDLT